MNLIKLHDAAQELGISYPTLKQWIYKQKIKSIQTAGGHHRIPREEIDRLLQKPKNDEKQIELNTISGRNKLAGRISEIKTAGLLSQVTIVLDGGEQQITAIITADSARSLNLKTGANVHALIKATEVMIIGG